MPHEFEWNKYKARKIELLIPRLKYSVYPTHVVQWLENFEKDEVDHMIDLLRVFEYITFSEFMSRLNSLLFEIFKKYRVEERFLIYPYGKVGKSGTLVTYPLRNTKAYKSRESSAKKKLGLQKKDDYNVISHDYEKISISDNIKYVIFLDDFVGSGDTFIKEFGKIKIQEWLKKMQISKVFLLASIVMEGAVKNIQRRFPNVEVVADIRRKIRPTIFSAKFLFSSIDKVTDIVMKYGSTIPVNRPPKQFTPLGYSDSESLVSFFHGTPNNTLPIFWGEGNGWKPLFPRNSITRMYEAKKIKRDIKYYLSLFDKIGHDLIEGTRIIDGFSDGRTSSYKDKNLQNHAVITLIYLITLELDTVIICQILGLSREELSLVQKECRIKKLISTEYNLTNKAKKILQQLEKKKRQDSIRNETFYNLEIKKMLYLPRSFKGNT